MTRVNNQNISHFPYYMVKMIMPYIVLDKVININLCFISPQKTYVVGTHWKCLREVLLMSTHNICFLEDIRKISVCWLKKVPYLELCNQVHYTMSH